MVVLSCSDKKSTTPTPPAETEVHAPWDNEEAEEMAVIMGGELAAPLELYEQVLADLDAIRSTWGERLPIVTAIEHIPKWQTGKVEISVDAETYADIRTGFPPDWDSLNQSLRIDHASLNDSALSITITFDARLAPQPLARLYAGLPGVRWAKMIPTGAIGPLSVDGAVDGDSRFYLFSQPPPACEKLCEDADLWLFRVTGSNVDSVAAWTSINPHEDSDSLGAWSDAMNVKALALAPGSSGDFPDSDLIAPAIIGAIEGFSPSSRSLLLRWQAPGDDGISGVASGYEISVTGPMYPERVFSGETLPGRAGRPESLLVEGLLPDLSYRVVVRAADEQGNWSPWSPNAFIRSLGPWANFTVQNSSLANNTINGLAIDQYGRLWCATGGGISRFDGSNWSTFLTLDGRSVVNSRSITFDAGRQTIWCAADGGAICGIRTNVVSQLSFGAGAIGLSGANIATIEIAPGGNLWCSNALSGVSRWDGTTWTTFSAGNPGLVNNTVWDIAAAPNGNIWFATNGGVSRFDGTTWTNYTIANSDIGANITHAIAVDANGVVWCGHHDKSVGLSTFDGAIWRTQSRADSLPSTYINTIAFSAPGVAWLGTTLGLAKPGSPWQSLLTDNSPIIDNTINALAFTTDAKLWIGTPKGLSRYELPIGGM